MKISVIIPNYNDIRIKRSLDSIYSQTVKNFEVIVVDGLSTNGDLLEIYKQYDLDCLICEKDDGIFDALNKGISRSTGEIIFLLGSDDFLKFNKTFERVLSEFKSNRDIDGICIGCVFVNSSKRVIREWFPKSVTSKKIKMGIYPPHFSLFLKRELYELVGEFKFKMYGNFACDTIWLLDLAIRKRDLSINVLNNYYLVMEYGGTSTESITSIYRQFKVVKNYVKEKRIHFWLFHPFIKIFSKIFQLKINKKIL